MTMSCTTGQLYTTTSAARQTSDTPDVALIRAISAGDKHAMQILFARHNVPVFRFLLRFVGNKSAAEDLVSEVFLDVWRQAGRFQGRSQVILRTRRKYECDLSPRWRHEHVANAAHGADSVGVRRIQLNFAAQAGDTQVDSAVERLHLAVRSHLQ
jgi:Sigma-70 region 2